MQHTLTHKTKFSILNTVDIQQLSLNLIDYDSILTINYQIKNMCPLKIVVERNIFTLTFQEVNYVALMF